MPSMMDDSLRGSPPPRYTESNAHMDAKNADAWSQSANPWLVGRTSIHVESSSAADGSSTRQASIAPSKMSDGTGPVRSFFRKEDIGRLEESPDREGEFELGTQVVIEASMPIKSSAERRIEMKGLEHAASARKWNGNGQPAEAWGKLMKDPELWDEAGDTCIFFGYQRPHPSFRVKSSLLEETKSEHLISKLREGQVKDFKANRPGSISTNSSASVHTGMKSLSLSSKSRRQETVSEVPVRYEIYFPAPPEASRVDILRHHLTTRNIFALLSYKPLVGLTFYQALVDLQERLEDLIPGANSAQTIIRYLVRTRLHNVSNEPAAAAGFLAWSEDNFWSDGWREGYVHCSGMYARLRPMPVFRDISHVTRALLERSNLELQVRLQETEERLRSFHFDDMWSAYGLPAVPTTYNAFRKFLVRHYEKVYKTWPPRPVEEGGTWLSRSLIHHLQADFCALYNFYVDSDAVWDASNAHIVHRADRSPLRSSSPNELCLERAIIAFDQKHRFSHLPHPQPLLPQSITVGEAARHSQSKSMFASKAKTLEKKILAASGEASNAILLGPDVTSNSMVEAFVKFDRSDRVGEEDPRTVRKTRWLLLYGILQTLSAVGADTPQLWFKDNVEYFLNTKLKGMPPWKGSEPAFQDAGRTEIYRWLNPKSA